MTVGCSSAFNVAIRLRVNEGGAGSRRIQLCLAPRSRRFPQPGKRLLLASGPLECGHLLPLSPSVERLGLSSHNQSSIHVQLSKSSSLPPHLHLPSTLLGCITQGTCRRSLTPRLQCREVDSPFGPTSCRNQTPPRAKTAANADAANQKPDHAAATPDLGQCTMTHRLRQRRRAGTGGSGLRPNDRHNRRWSVAICLITLAYPHRRSHPRCRDPSSPLVCLALCSLLIALKCDRQLCQRSRPAPSPQSRAGESASRTGPRGRGCADSPESEGRRPGTDFL